MGVLRTAIIAQTNPLLQNQGIGKQLILLHIHIFTLALTWKSQCNSPHLTA